MAKPVARHLAPRCLPPVFYDTPVQRRRNRHHVAAFGLGVIARFWPQPDQDAPVLFVEAVALEVLDLARHLSHGTFLSIGRLGADSRFPAC